MVDRANSHQDSTGCLSLARLFRAYRKPKTCTSVTSYSSSSGNDVSDDDDDDDETGRADAADLTTTTPNSLSRDAVTWWDRHCHMRSGATSKTSQRPVTSPPSLETSDVSHVINDVARERGVDEDGDRTKSSDASTGSKGRPDVGDRSSLLYAVPPTPVVVQTTAVQLQQQRLNIGGRRLGLAATLPVTTSVPVNWFWDVSELQRYQIPQTTPRCTEGVIDADNQLMYQESANFTGPSYIGPHCVCSTCVSLRQRANRSNPTTDDTSLYRYPRSSARNSGKEEVYCNTTRHRAIDDVITVQTDVIGDYIAPGHQADTWHTANTRKGNCNYMAYDAVPRPLPVRHHPLSVDQRRSIDSHAALYDVPIRMVSGREAVYYNGFQTSDTEASGGGNRSRDKTVQSYRTDRKEAASSVGHRRDMHYLQSAAPTRSFEAKRTTSDDKDAMADGSCQQYDDGEFGHGLFSGLSPTEQEGLKIDTNCQPRPEEQQQRCEYRLVRSEDESVEIGRRSSTASEVLPTEPNDESQVDGDENNNDVDVKGAAGSICVLEDGPRTQRRDELVNQRLDCSPETGVDKTKSNAVERDDSNPLSDEEQWDTKTGTHQKQLSHNPEQLVHRDCGTTTTTSVVEEQRSRNFRLQLMDAQLLRMSPPPPTPIAVHPKSDRYRRSNATSCFRKTDENFQNAASFSEINKRHVTTCHDFRLNSASIGSSSMSTGKVNALVAPPNDRNRNTPAYRIYQRKHSLGRRSKSAISFETIFEGVLSQRRSGSLSLRSNVQTK